MTFASLALCREIDPILMATFLRANTHESSIGKKAKAIALLANFMGKGDLTCAPHLLDMYVDAPKKDDLADAVTLGLLWVTRRKRTIEYCLQNKLVKLERQ